MSAEQHDFALKFVPKEPYELQGGVYAWGKTARLITEPAYFEARDQIKTDLVAVDLCSSFPYFREIMTGQHKQLMHTEAYRITGKFIDGLHRLSPKNNELRFAAMLDKNNLILLRKELGPRHNLARQLLVAPIFETMTNPPPTDKRDPKSISKILLEKFMESKTYYKFVYEPTGKAGDKGTWVFITPAASDIPLRKIIEPMLGDKTSEFLEDISSYFGEQLASENRLRRITFLSLDFAPFENLVRDAKNGFPLKLRNTLFFQSVQNPRRHMRADIRSLQFKESGIGFFSSIEGWPYYGKDFGFEGNMAVAKKISFQLAAGGKAVFFPWNMQDNDSVSQNLLAEIEKEWQKLGLTIAKEQLTIDGILESMTDRELVLANHSPVLRQVGPIESLILSKPTS
ncbi:MAG: hypothetical protein A3H17_00570 [Candidatus Levybacteria bacterium RIFCSPLOWO2_12_FULL_37_14]|nr:MAG: hypothetical protein A3H17_00570 [Candidatus Levybacteria bacterium RIFCSPLOWO2_12_FULL_37_14]